MGRIENKLPLENELPLKHGKRQNENSKQVNFFDFSRFAVTLKFTPEEYNLIETSH